MNEHFTKVCDERESRERDVMKYLKYEVCIIEQEKYVANIIYLTTNNLTYEWTLNSLELEREM